MQNRCICCSIANFLSSGCVVNESMLTGEPMPIQKFVVDDSPAVLDANSAARHQVYAGTTVLQSSSFHQSGNALLFCPRKKSQRKFSETSIKKVENNQAITKFDRQIFIQNQNRKIL